ATAREETLCCRSPNTKKRRLIGASTLSSLNLSLVIYCTKFGRVMSQSYFVRGSRSQWANWEYPNAQGYIAAVRSCVHKLLPIRVIRIAASTPSRANETRHLSVSNFPPLTICTTGVRLVLRLPVKEKLPSTVGKSLVALRASRTLMRFCLAALPV